MNAVSEVPLPAEDGVASDPVPTLAIRAGNARLLLIVLLTYFFIATFVDAQAQEVPNAWSETQLIYETERVIDTPFLIADNFGGTHLFWRESYRVIESDQQGLEQLFYSVRNSYWSTGVDIVASGSVVGPTTAIDTLGRIHLVWTGGNILWHSIAPLPAESAHNWSQPEAIAASNLHALVVADSSGAIHVTYPGLLSSGPYYLKYDSTFDTWSEPISIAAARPKASADFTRIAIGPDHTFHVVWSEFLLPEGWPPTGVYYSQSQDSGQTWSTPFELAGHDYDQVNVAVGLNGQVHVVWNGMVGVGGRYHRWSDDGGKMWSDIVAVVPAGKGGTEGPPQLVIDNAGTVHLLTTFDGCTWYAAWTSGSWSDPTCISGPRAMASHYIEEPALTLANGNQLHAVFWDDRARLWYTTMLTGAPPTYDVPPTPEAPLAIMSPTVVATPMVEEESTRIPIPSLLDEPTAGSSSGRPGETVMMATISVLLFVGTVVLVRAARPRSNN